MSGKINRRRLFGGTTAVLGGAALPALAATGASAGRGRRVKTGIEVLAENGFTELAGQAVGVVSNPTGVLPALRHEVDLMPESGDVNIVAVFGPEHGFRGTSQAGEGEDHFLDPKTGIPVYNAYNNKDRMTELFADTVEDGADIDEETGLWADDLAAFADLRESHLIYRRKGR